MYLGVDIGGTKIGGIVLDKTSQKMVAVFNTATPKNKKDFLKALEEKISSTMKKYKISGIGIGLPGIVDAKNDVLARAPNLPFLKNWRARKFFSKFGKKIMIGNDSQCFLIAEAKLGAGKACRNIAAMTIGTGIGGGLMIDGKIYHGKNNSAGEFGHMIINKRETLEKLGAKKAFLKMGDRSEIIGIGVANIINALNPDIVILGGGGVASGGVKLDIVRKIAKKYIISPLAKKTQIIKSKLGENASATGAALLFKIKI